MAADLLMAAIAQTEGGFDWLGEEPEIYTDPDVLPLRFSLKGRGRSGKPQGPAPNAL